MEEKSCYFRHDIDANEHQKFDESKHCICENCGDKLVNIVLGGGIRFEHKNTLVLISPGKKLIRYEPLKRISIGCKQNG